jgi:hypothetical protein
MPVEQTAHEQREYARDRDQHWTRRALDRRKELMRECPVDRFLDRAHVREALGSSPTGNRQILLWQQLLLRGGGGGVIPRRDLERAFGRTPDQAQAIIDAPLWWELPAGFERDIPPAYHALLIGTR